jgi:hypothetical protein
MVALLKIAGLALGLLGLVVTLLDILGKFRDTERLEFARLLRDCPEGLARSTPGFDEFLSAFPPPAGVDKRSVVSTAKDVFQTHDQFPISITIRYFADGQRTLPVATYAAVVAWSEKTRQRWWSLIIGSVGWLMLAAALAIEAGT